jgi:hypothetical protein
MPIISESHVLGVSALPKPTTTHLDWHRCCIRQLRLAQCGLGSDHDGHINASMLGAVVLLHSVLPHHRLADGAV